MRLLDRNRYLYWNPIIGNLTLSFPYFKSNTTKKIKFPKKIKIYFLNW